MVGAVYLAAKPYVESVSLPKSYHSFERRLNRARSAASRVAYGIAVVLPLLLARSLCAHWQDWLLLRYGWSLPIPQPWGDFADPFALYCLPFLRALTGAFWIAAIMTLLLVAVLSAPRAFYQALARDRSAGKAGWSLVPLLLAVLFGLRAIGYGLQRIESGLPLLYEFSPATLLLLAGGVACAVLALTLLLLCLTMCFRPELLSAYRWTFRRSLTTILAALTALFMPSILAGAFLLQVNRINPMDSDTRSSSAAKLAWGLDKMQVDSAPASDHRPPGKILPAVPIWSEDRLQAVSAQEWPAKSMSPPQRGQFEIAGRRILLATGVVQPANAGKPLPWGNRHLADIASPSAEAVAFEPVRAAAGRAVRRDIGEFAKAGPVFYGAVPQDWLLSAEQAEGAVDLSAWWRRAAWAIRLRDTNLLLAEPRYRYLLWRRTAQERLSAVAPFLVAGGEPQLVVAFRKLFWMSDGLLATRTFAGGPQAEDGPLQGYNAAFDSVKMLMDPRTGGVVFYAARPQAQGDPLLQVWRRAFPGLFYSHEWMPEELRRQRRYSQVLFEVQAKLLAGWQKWQLTEQQEILGGASTASRTLNAAYTLSGDGDAAQMVLQMLLVSRDGSQIEGQLVAGCGERYSELRLLRDVAGSVSPLSFTRALEEAILTQNGALPQKLGADEHWGFGDVQVAPGRGGETWVPVFRTSEKETRLTAVIVQRGARRGVGSSVEEAYFDLLRKYLSLEAGRDSSVQDLVARAAKLQTEAENAVQRGAMSQWSRIMAEQRATLLRLQGKLSTSKND